MAQSFQAKICLSACRHEGLRFSQNTFSLELAGPVLPNLGDHMHNILSLTRYAVCVALNSSKSYSGIVF